MKPTLIAFEGGDGAGKETQVKAFCDYLLTRTPFVKRYQTPLYDTVTGKLIADYLSGKLGNPADIDSRLAALLYSVNRAQHMEDWAKMSEVNWKYIIADRWTGTNLVYHGESPVDQQFINHVETEILGIPVPDVTFWLDTRPKDGQAAMEGREVIDEFEKSRVLQEQVWHRYRNLCETDPNWIRISTYDSDGKRLTPAEVTARTVEAFLATAAADHLQDVDWISEQTDTDLTTPMCSNGESRVHISVQKNWKEITGYQLPRFNVPSDTDLVVTLHYSVGGEPSQELLDRTFLYVTARHVTVRLVCNGQVSSEVKQRVKEAVNSELTIECNKPLAETLT